MKRSFPSGFDIEKHLRFYARTMPVKKSAKPQSRKHFSFEYKMRLRNDDEFVMSFALLYEVQNKCQKSEYGGNPFGDTRKSCVKSFSLVFR